MKGFDTISYAADLANKFLLLTVVLKVPAERERERENWRLSSKLFFHPQLQQLQQPQQQLLQQLRQRIVLYAECVSVCVCVCGGNKKMPQITRARAVNPP